MKGTAALVVMLTAVVFLVLADSASAQCAMCRAALEQDGGRLALGFNRAILFLLVMPYVVFASIAGTWYWKRWKAGPPSRSYGEPRRSPSRPREASAGPP